MDTLIGLTDAIHKCDVNLEAIIRKVEKQRRDLDSVWDVRISTNQGESRPVSFHLLR